MGNKTDIKSSFEDAERLMKRNAIVKKFVSDKQILKSMVEELQFVQVGVLKNMESMGLYSNFYDKLQEFKRGLLMDIENL